jgi:hypothetical protein
MKHRKRSIRRTFGPFCGFRAINFASKLAAEARNERLPLHCCNTCGPIHSTDGGDRL